MITIRPARIEEAAILCSAEREIAQTPGLLISRPEELRPETFSALIEKLTNGAGWYVVAEENGACVGHALLNPMELSAVAHVFRLTIVVHPGQSGRGIGTLLMQSLCDWAKNSPQLHKVELLVRATNERALSLYRKFGFIEEGRFRERVRMPDGTFVDEIAMGWFPNRP
jgi:RimJ/RimL family protein N-acetyltransferase